MEIIDEDSKQTLFKRRSARWGARSEPGDEDRAPEQPRLLRRTIDLLVNENVMPVNAIPRHLGLAAYDVEMLTGLPIGYLQGKDNVVQLARLRTTSTSTEERATQNSTVLQFRAQPKI